MSIVGYALLALSFWKPVYLFSKYVYLRLRGQYADINPVVDWFKQYGALIWPGKSDQG